MPQPQRKKGLSAIPSVVQLPGGVRLTAVPFRIASYDDEGRPLTFEIQPPGTAMPPAENGGLMLFADEAWLRMSRVGKSASERAAAEATLERERCDMDTDGDGNCPRHPEGCP